MSELVEYEWLGGRRMIPGYGEPDTGDTILLPKDKGDSFVKQGLAKRTSAKAIQVKAKTSSQSKTKED